MIVVFSLKQHKQNKTKKLSWHVSFNYVADFYKLLKILRNIHFYMKITYYDVYDRKTIKLGSICGVALEVWRELILLDRSI